MVYTVAMNTTVQALLEQERFFRENASAIANGDAGVLNELFSRFSPSLSRDEMIKQAELFTEEKARGGVVYNKHWGLSNIEAIQVTRLTEQQQYAKALDLSLIHI